MAKKKKKEYDFSRKTVLARRKFPTLNTVLLLLLVAAQIFCVCFMFAYEPVPQDRIDSYEIYVSPRSDGSLDIEYRFKWTALDPEEELTWVEIGVANSDFDIYRGYSSNIRSIKNDSYDDECYVRIDFDRGYRDGEQVAFSFKINQRDMLCNGGNYKFYEFVPGWFNKIPVSSYAFYWKNDSAIIGTNADSTSGDWLMWSGSLDIGEYRMMKVNYDVFDASTTHYRAFDDDGAFNGLEGEKTAVCVLMCLVLIAILAFEIMIIDSYVSYSRGRGFLRGYGYHVHVYGRRNPHYVRAHNAASSRRGSGGGGCACACACACAGGGRAGCSQKDTYRLKNDKNISE